MSALGMITVGVAVLATAILTVYWIKSPQLSLAWRLLLFAGIAVLPTIAAGTSTVDGMTGTTKREFCGSCHVMEAHFEDATDPKSLSLASRHTRNHAFGEQSCYSCHADYGMYGYPLTKLNGLKHVWHYYFGEYGSMPLAEALPKLHLYKPFSNDNCTHCHAGTGAFWQNVPDHRAVEEDARAGRVSCASAGCHGAVHPFTREARRAAGLPEAGVQEQGSPAGSPAARTPEQEAP